MRSTRDNVSLEVEEVEMVELMEGSLRMFPEPPIPWERWVRAAPRDAIWRILGGGERCMERGLGEVGVSISRPKTVVVVSKD